MGQGPFKGSGFGNLEDEPTAETGKEKDSGVTPDTMLDAMLEKPTPRRELTKDPECIGKEGIASSSSASDGISDNNSRSSGCRCNMVDQLVNDRSINVEDMDVGDAPEMWVVTTEKEEQGRYVGISKRETSLVIRQETERLLDDRSKIFSSNLED